MLVCVCVWLCVRCVCVCECEQCVCVAGVWCESVEV